MHFEEINKERIAGLIHGERFQVAYELKGTEAECRKVAHEICIEQTIEFPIELVPDCAIGSSILGRIESFEKSEENTFIAKISYPIEDVGGEFVQFLNVLFGNFSLQPDVRVVDVILSPGIYEMLKGPRFGIPGLRGLAGEEKYPLLFTALKPLGLSSPEFAHYAKIFAENGIHIIKDDHGLANQSFAPFKERVRACSDAVAEANAKTNGHAIYVPNITGPMEGLRERALYAKECGAGGLMICAGLSGLDGLRSIAEDDEIALPVFSHPAFSGSYAVNPQGISCRIFYGLLMRLAGSDAVIYPNYGGRFHLSVEECVSIADTGRDPLGRLKPMFSCPAGGMKFERIEDMIKHYGRDIVLLIGGGLFGYSDDLAYNCRKFAETVKEYSDKVF